MWWDLRQQQVLKRTKHATLLLLEAWALSPWCERQRPVSIPAPRSCHVLLAAAHLCPVSLPAISVTSSVSCPKPSQQNTAPALRSREPLPRGTPRCSPPGSPHPAREKGGRWLRNPVPLLQKCLVKAVLGK